jgi:hypothetical protein
MSVFTCRVGPPRPGHLLVVAVVAVAVTAGLPIAWAAPATAVEPAAAEGAVFVCDYRFSAWTGGFVADLTITNRGPAVTGWTARWSMPTATGNLGAWLAKLEQPDAFTMTATNMPYNAVIDTGRSVKFGWTASAAGTAAPSDITVNGAPC